MNAKDIGKLLIPFGIGAATMALIGFFVILPAISGPLNDTIASIKRSLGTAQELNRQLSASNKRLAGELDTASNTVTEQKSTIDRLAGDLAKQREIANATERGLGALANSIQSGGDSLVARAQAIADGFDKLFTIYH